MTLSAEFNNKSQNKIKQHFVNYLLITCIALSIIYFCGGYFKWLELVVSILAGIFFIFTPIQKSFCLFLFLHNFLNSNINTAYGFRLTFSLFTIILGVKYLIGLKQKKYKFYLKIFLCWLAVFVISVLISLPKKQYYAAETYLCYIPLVYLFFAVRKEINIHQAMNYFLLGFVLSCLLAYLSIPLPNYSYHVTIARFNGFSENPNYLYMRALLIICYYMHLFLSGNLSFLKLALIYTFSGYITLATRSKTGIFLLLLLTLLFFVIYLRNEFKKRIKITGICLAFILVFAFCMQDYILSIWERFTYSNGDFLNSLLTGRDTIWIEYLKQWCKNPVSFLFGKGLLTAEPYVEAHNSTMASHNLYLFLLYRFGLLGCSMLGYSLYLMIKKLTKKEILISAYLPLTWLLLESFCDNTFKVFNFMLIIIPFLILFSHPIDTISSDSNESKKINRKK